MSKLFFLAKAGKIHGPLLQSEIDLLRESGEYEKFSWFWAHEKNSWQPIDPAPLESPRREPVVASTKEISAVCYDNQVALSGWLSRATDSGCEFRTRSPATSPELSGKSAILLHLFDPGTGRSMNVSGRVGHAERRDGQWHYRIHWKNLPELI